MHNITQHNTSQHNATQHNAAQHSTAQQNADSHQLQHCKVQEGLAMISAKLIVGEYAVAELQTAYVIL